MRSLVGRALAAVGVIAGALIISVPAASAAGHGQNGAGNGNAGAAHGNGHGNKGGQSGSGNGSTHGKKGGNSGGGSTHGNKGGKSGSGGQAPAGNNGTIKVDQAPLTSGSGANHANHPHVTCQLALSFWGFDAGTDTAQVAFSAQPPSGKFTPVPVTSGPTQFQFTVNQRTGGGQLDTSQAYTLDTSGLTAAKQGYHIRVTTHVTYSQGSDVKQKVFWYQPCTSTGTTGSGSGTGSNGQPTSHKKPHHSAGSSKSSVSSTKTVTSRSSQSRVTESERTRITKSKTELSSSRSKSSNSSGLGGFGLGSGPGSSGELASSNTGNVPSGAGTDLGWFSPAGSSPVLPGLGLGGAALLGGGGALVRRRLRKRSA